MGDLKERDVKGCVVVIEPTSAAESSGCLSAQIEGVVVSAWEPWCGDANGGRVASHSEGRSAGSSSEGRRLEEAFCWKGHKSGFNLTGSLCSPLGAKTLGRC